MKIITYIVSDITTKSGVNKVVSEIANQLVEQYIVRIISVGKKNLMPYFKLDSQIKVEYVLKKKVDCHKDIIRFVAPLRIAIDKNTNYLIFSDLEWVLYCYPCIKRKKKLGVKNILWEHTNFYNGKKFGPAWFGRKIAIKLFDKIVTLTNIDNNNYLEHGGDSTYIYNPIVDDINVEYQRDSKRIVSCGSLVNYKGFDLLLDVASLVFESHPDWSWEIYGEGEEYSNLVNLINSKNLECNVFLKGYEKDISKIYENAALFVLTSRFEGFGMVITEAQKYKLPIVSFACKYGPIELIKDSVNGFLVDCYDIKMMAEKINYLIDNANIRIEMSSKSKIKFGELKMSTVIDKWVSILK